MQWQEFEAYEYQGLRLAMKSESFPIIMDLPQRVGPLFEIALRGNNTPFATLRQAGWQFADIDAVSQTPWSYQAFIHASKAEFCIAKAGYVATNCGWFSECSAVYLASGRPVLHQDTGFSRWLPCGNGVFAFSGSEDAADAIRRIEMDYEIHCRAAREIAEEYFAARRVLPQLLDAAISAAG